MDENLHDHAKRVMTHESTFLSPPQRRIVLDALKETLTYDDVPSAALAVGAEHAHLLARFEPGRRTASGKLITDPSHHFVGLARKRGARRLSNLGVASGGVETGGVWSKSTKVVPIADERHFHNTRRYILDHKTSRAVVWSSDPGPVTP